MEPRDPQLHEQHVLEHVQAVQAGRDGPVMAYTSFTSSNTTMDTESVHSPSTRPNLVRGSKVDRSNAHISV